MFMFGSVKEKESKVQRLLTKIINSHCLAVDALREGLRDELRREISLVVIVVPRINGRPDLDSAFSTVSREVSSTGMSLVLAEDIASEGVFLVFKVEGDLRYTQGDVRHQTHLGAGLRQAGIRLTEVCGQGDYPELTGLRI